MPYFLCLNDEERSSIEPLYVAVVGAAVEAIVDRAKRIAAGHDLDALECLANELDSADLQALAKLGEDDSPDAAILNRRHDQVRPHGTA